MKLPPLTLPPITGTQGIFAQRRKGKSYWPLRATGVFPGVG